MKYTAQFYYTPDRRWVDIKSGRSYARVREALHRFWQGCKLYETRIVSE